MEKHLHISHPPPLPVAPKRKVLGPESGPPTAGLQHHHCSFFCKPGRWEAQFYSALQQAGGGQNGEEIRTSLCVCVCVLLRQALLTSCPPFHPQNASFPLLNVCQLKRWPRSEEDPLEWRWVSKQPFYLLFVPLMISSCSQDAVEPVLGIM